MEPLELISAAFRLVPEILRSLEAGKSEADIRRILRENRAEIDDAFDAAQARIEAPRTGDGEGDP